MPTVLPSRSFGERTSPVGIDEDGVEQEAAEIDRRQDDQRLARAQRLQIGDDRNLADVERVLLDHLRKAHDGNRRPQKSNLMMRHGNLRHGAWRAARQSANRDWL